MMRTKVIVTSPADDAARAAARAAALTASLVIGAGCASGVLSGSDTTTTAEPSISSTTGATAAPANTSTTAVASGVATGSVADLPSGWKVLNGTGLSVGVPTEWLDLKPLVTDPKARAEFEKSIQDQSSSAYIDSIAPQLLDQINLIAMDGTTAATSFTTTMNVIIDRSGLIQDLSTLESLLASQLGSVGGEISATNRAQIGGIDTLVVDYTLTTAQGVKATGRQYHQLVNNSVVTATFTSLPDQADPTLWDQMTGTITLGTT